LFNTDTINCFDNDHEDVKIDRSVVQHTEPNKYICILITIDVLYNGIHREDDIQEDGKYDKNGNKKILCNEETNIVITKIHKIEENKENDINEKETTLHYDNKKIKLLKNYGNKNKKRKHKTNDEINENNFPSNAHLRKKEEENVVKEINKHYVDRFDQKEYTFCHNNIEKGNHPFAHVYIFISKEIKTKHSHAGVKKIQEVFVVPTANIIKHEKDNKNK